MINGNSKSLSEMYRTKLRVGDLAYQRGQFSSAMSNYEGARVQAEHLNDENCVSIAYIKMAICLSAQDRLSEAEELIYKAASIERTSNLLGLNEAALLHHELSILLFRLNKSAEGLQEETKALELLRQANDVDVELLVLVLKQLAVYSSEQGQFKQAESILAEAMPLGRKSAGKDSLLYGQLLVTEAILKIDMKNFEEAKELYDRAITLIEINIGQFNPKVAQLFRIIARHLKNAGDLESAADFERRAEDIEKYQRKHKLFVD